MLQVRRHAIGCIFVEFLLLILGLDLPLVEFIEAFVVLDYLLVNCRVSHTVGGCTADRTLGVHLLKATLLNKFHRLSCCGFEANQFDPTALLATLAGRPLHNFVDLIFRINSETRVKVTDD